MSLYQDLRSLQNIPHAYENWTEYRRAVTSYLIANTDCDSSLAIFGAGKCNDLDLALLVSHFSSLTLIDINSRSMAEALEQYRLTDYPNIRLCEYDLVGIPDSSYEEFADTLTEQIQLFGTSVDPQYLQDIALSYLHSVYEAAARHNVSFGKGHFDYSVALGLHSQLNNMAAWIWTAVTAPLRQSAGAMLPNGASASTSPEWAGTSVAQYIASNNQSIIERVNDTILECTRKAVLFGNERTGTASDGPIAGAVECILDIRKRFPDCTTAIVNWDFDPASGKSYEMLLQTAGLTA